MMKRIAALLTLFCLYQVKTIKWTHRGTGCPDTWHRFGATDRCFYTGHSADTYDNAVKDCASRNSELAPLITCAQHYHLNQYILVHKLNSENIWIGINNISGNGWRSTTGTEAKCSFWAGHFPRSNGRCVVMSHRTNIMGYVTNISRGEWLNDDCNKKFKYICIQCPDKYQYIPELNECIILNPTPRTWRVAQLYCQAVKWGGQLLTIRGPRKQQIVEDYLKTMLARKETEICVQSSPSPGNIIWMGGQTENPNQCGTPYVWRTYDVNKRSEYKLERTPDNPFIYKNWFSGKPSCSHKGDNCAIIAPERNYTWEDANCASKLCYMCESP